MCEVPHDILVNLWKEFQNLEKNAEKTHSKKKGIQKVQFKLIRSNSKKIEFQFFVTVGRPTYFELHIAQ